MKTFIENKDTKSATELNRVSNYKNTCVICRWRKTGSLHNVCQHCLRMEQVTNDFKQKRKAGTYY